MNYLFLYFSLGLVFKDFVFLWMRCTNPIHVLVSKTLGDANCWYQDDVRTKQDKFYKGAQN